MCQFTAAKRVSKHIHHSGPCSEEWEIDIKLIALHIRCMLWLPTMEVQDAPYRYTDLHVEDAEGINTGLNNNNESTSGSDTTIALGGPEAKGHHNELIPSNQAKLTALTREINDLHQ